MNTFVTEVLKKYQKKLDVDDIENFRHSLNSSIDTDLKRLDSSYETASASDFEDHGDVESYRNHLEGLMDSYCSAKSLGSELCIIALYKKVEIKIKKIVKSVNPELSVNRISTYSKLVLEYPQLTALDGFLSFDELRLINNSIKHGGEVLSSLSKSFPDWIEGEELDGLDEAYMRLLPGIKRYMSEFVEMLYVSNASN